MLLINQVQQFKVVRNKFNYMSKNTLIYLIVILFIPYEAIFSQGWTVSKVINGSEIEPRYNVLDNNGNCYLLVTYKDTLYNPFVISKGNYDLLLIKLNSNGNILWYKQIGGTGLDNAGGLNLVGSQLFVTVNFQNVLKFTNNDSLVSKGGLDFALCKFSITDGNFISAKTIGTSDGTYSQSVLATSIYNSKLILAGNFGNSIYLGVNPYSDTLIANAYVTNFIAQLNFDGELEWSKTIYGSSTNYKVSKIGVSENGYYFGGFFRGSVTFDVGVITSYTSGYNDNFIYKTDFSGAGEWIRKIYGSQTENIQAVTTDGYDNVYILGNYGSPILYVDSTQTLVKSHPVNLGNFDTYICKYNRSGILQWLILKGSPGRDIYNDFILGNNVIFATGYFTNQIIFNNDTINSTGLANSDAFVAAFNQIGDPISGASIIGTGDYEDAGVTVNMDINSRAYITGYYKSREIKIGNQTYTSNNTNKSDLFFAIYQQPFKAVITEQNNISCYGLSNGLLRATPYFGRPPYTYSWSHDPDLHLSVATDLSPGTYTVTITDANDSTAIISTIITQPLPLSISGTITQVKCNNEQNGQINITVTGGTKTNDYSYYWTSPDGIGINPLAEDQTTLSKGIYMILVRDDNLCELTDTFVVTQPDEIHFKNSSANDIHIPPGNDGAVNLSVNGGNLPYGYLWSGPSSFSSTTEDISNLSTAGQYQISITDNKSCAADTSFLVSDGTTLIAQITQKTDVRCFGQNNGSATVSVVNGVPPYSFQWADLAIPITNPTREGMAEGTYYVMVSDANLPVPHTAQASVEISGPVSALNLTLDAHDLRCHNDNSGLVNLAVSGGTLPYSYLWNNGYTGEDQVNVPIGLYSVTVTDTNGCIAQTSSEIEQPDPINPDPSVVSPLHCFGDMDAIAMVEASGGVGAYSYLWDDPGAQVTKSAYDLSAGTYHVTVTDENECFKTAGIQIIPPYQLAVQPSFNMPSCPGLSDGAINTILTGGTPPYANFIWSNNVNTQNNINIPSGTYTLEYDDANNCHYTGTYILQNPDTVKITEVDIIDPSCSGHSDGSLAITATGGSRPYEYSNDAGLNFSSDSSFTLLPQGNYILLVRDDNGCMSEEYEAALIKPENCALIIYDAFSPDENGKNDVWHIGNIESFPDCKVKIFNIWGVLIFSSNGYGTPWDGKYKGNYLPAGTYYYVIDPGDGSETFTGAVSIVK
jgi:gliding motility-associated-like protein